jgi:hypothetical protein
MRNSLKIITAGVAVAFLAGASGAEASSLITSSDIKDGAVHTVDTSPKVQQELASTLKGARFRVENYMNGGGGSATVACANDDATSQKFTAISGGVEGSTVASQSPTGFAVSSSFPGRMDWTTGTPKSGRLDGWIILGNGQQTSDLKVWALCVPTTDIPVQQIDLNN